MAYGEWCPTCGSPIIAVTRGIPSMGRCENGHDTDRRNCLRGEPLKEDKDATIARFQRELAEARDDLNAERAARAVVKAALHGSQAERDALIGAAIREVWGRCEELEDEAYAKLPTATTDHEKGFWAAQKMTAKRLRRATLIPSEASAALATVRAEARKDAARKVHAFAAKNNWHPSHVTELVTAIIAAAEKGPTT